MPSVYRYSDDILNQDLIPDRMYSARHARKTGKRALLSDKRLSWGASIIMITSEQHEPGLFRAATSVHNAGENP
ncbi:hypothetical protein [Cupriavidus necator]